MRRVGFRTAGRCRQRAGSGEPCCAVPRIGFSNALFLARRHPEHGRTGAEHSARSALNLSLDAGLDLLGVDGRGRPSRNAPVRLPSTGYPLSPGRFHRSCSHRDAADSQRPCVPGRLNSGGSKSSSPLQGASGHWPGAAGRAVAPGCLELEHHLPGGGGLHAFVGQRRARDVAAQLVPAPAGRQRRSARRRAG